jgi:hypothetical protein
MMTPADDPPLSIKDASRRLALSTDTTRRLFANEPGILRIGQPTRKVGRKYRRRYFSIRIPMNVFRRVEDRLRQK